ncbi:hypothetical protein BCT27_08385 [Enterovibrio norvegicus]|uniref:Uncharacterized protein n=1 Tax=Enterovibrio norvegicus TaxID=188144 RepID=A0A2N7LCV2_9GAMM|nr:hypothetical protein BCT27_08385 [Enterovibrio norvegicus]PMN93166.1 hypothetical protein BCT23_13740 [Enterovibrio norvegicus]
MVITVPITLRKAIELQSPKYNEGVKRAQRQDHHCYKRRSESALGEGKINRDRKTKAKKDRPLEATWPFTEVISKYAINLIGKRFSVVHHFGAILLPISSA